MSQNQCLQLVPGPTTVSESILSALAQNYASSDLETDFIRLYSSCQSLFYELFEAPSDKFGIVMMSGEAMLGLWGCLKSVIRAGDRVLVVANGLFGEGFYDMAKSIGAEVEICQFDWDKLPDEAVIRQKAEQFRPKLITAVHCETPSGVLNSLDNIGAIAKDVNALFLVDFVSSAAGTPVLIDSWNIDLGILGSQKALSLPPGLTILTVSQKAWEIVDQVNYFGYDALKPWRNVPTDLAPYTLNWASFVALELRLKELKSEGFSSVYRRHDDVAAFCRNQLRQIGLEIVPNDDSICSPTVTVAKIPSDISWEQLDLELRRRGVVVGGSYGKLAGRVFRIGHLGTQANFELIRKTMEILTETIASLRESKIC